MKFGTKAIHAGVEPDPTTGAIMTPIYQSTTFAQASPGKHKGYEYARTQNPTRKPLEAALAALENAKYGFAFASGMAATDTIIKMLRPGDEVICAQDMYGGTYRIFTRLFSEFGIKFHFVDTRDVANVKAVLTPNTKLVWLETPTNPLLEISDVQAICQALKNEDLMVVVDNTFATPYLQNPLDLGAHLVTHSSTKYLGGHSDVVGGAIMCNDSKLAEKLHFLQNSCGAVPAPLDCFLLLRSIKTLHLRMEAHNKNAAIVAKFLETIPSVAKVIYPGLESHNGHELAKKQMRGFGGMVSFILKDDSEEAAFRCLEKVKVFTLAESLGGVESLACHPGTMTHASIPVERRLEIGIRPSLIRLSVGVEDVEDLTADLAQALR
ncbi:MAG: cystathionine gamma-synthase [Bernardetiaceae bacterium]|nr:cystathionine gamma-synthase [Bernardetiaceae bacterium]